MPDASLIRANPMFVAFAMNTAIRLRLSSRERGFAPPAWVKQSRNRVCRSNSTSTDAIGAKGISAVSSSLRSAVSLGTSSAVKGPITRCPSSSSRTGPSSGVAIATRTPVAMSFSGLVNSRTPPRRTAPTPRR